MRVEEINSKVFDVISSIPDGQFVFVENIETGVSSWTKDAVEYFGLSGVNISNTKDVMRAMAHPDDLERLIEEIRAVFSLERKEFFLTFQVKNAKEEYVPCTCKGKMILGESGAPLIFAGSMTIHQGEEVNDAITDLPKLQTFLKDISRTKKKNKDE